jgi:hypothetical protein
MCYKLTYVSIISLLFYQIICQKCLRCDEPKFKIINLVLTGSLVGDGSGEVLMMTRQSACWLVSWCLIMWTMRSSWRRAAHHHLVATAPVYLADHKILASPWLRSNTCWVRQLPLLVSVSRRCRDPSGVTWFSSAQIWPSFLNSSLYSALCSVLLPHGLGIPILLGCVAVSHPSRLKSSVTTCNHLALKG